MADDTPFAPLEVQVSLSSVKRTFEQANMDSESLTTTGSNGQGSRDSSIDGGREVGERYKRSRSESDSFVGESNPPAFSSISSGSSSSESSDMTSHSSFESASSTSSSAIPSHPSPILSRSVASNTFMSMSEDPLYDGMAVWPSQDNSRPLASISPALRPWVSRRRGAEAPSVSDEDYRSSMQRSNAFDRHISVLRSPPPTRVQADDSIYSTILPYETSENRLESTNQSQYSGRRRDSTLPLGPNRPQLPPFGRDIDTDFPVLHEVINSGRSGSYRDSPATTGRRLPRVPGMRHRDQSPTADLHTSDHIDSFYDDSPPPLESTPQYPSTRPSLLGRNSQSRASPSLLPGTNDNNEASRRRLLSALQSYPPSPPLSFNRPVSRQVPRVGDAVPSHLAARHISDGEDNPVLNDIWASSRDNVPGGFRSSAARAGSPWDPHPVSPIPLVNTQSEQRPRNLVHSNAGEPRLSSRHNPAALNRSRVGSRHPLVSPHVSEWARYTATASPEWRPRFPLDDRSSGSDDGAENGAHSDDEQLSRILFRRRFPLPTINNREPSIRPSRQAPNQAPRGSVGVSASEMAESGRSTSHSHRTNTNRIDRLERRDDAADGENDHFKARYYRFADEPLCLELFSNPERTRRASMVTDISGDRSEPLRRPSYGARPGASNSLMWENAAERRRLGARAQLLSRLQNEMDQNDNAVREYYLSSIRPRSPDQGLLSSDDVRRFSEAPPPAEIADDQDTRVLGTRSRPSDALDNSRLFNTTQPSLSSDLPGFRPNLYTHRSGMFAGESPTRNPMPPWRVTGETVDPSSTDWPRRVSPLESSDIGSDFERLANDIARIPSPRRSPSPSAPVLPSLGVRSMTRDGWWGFGVPWEDRGLGSPPLPAGVYYQPPPAPGTYYPPPPRQNDDVGLHPLSSVSSSGPPGLASSRASESRTSIPRSSSYRDIDPDAYHDGPFRASLLRSIELDRSRSQRHSPSTDGVHPSNLRDRISPRRRMQFAGDLRSPIGESASTSLNSPLVHDDSAISHAQRDVEEDPRSRERREMHSYIMRGPRSETSTIEPASENFGEDLQSFRQALDTLRADGLSSRNSQHFVERFQRQRLEDRRRSSLWGDMDDEERDLMSWDLDYMSRARLRRDHSENPPSLRPSELPRRRPSVHSVPSGIRHRSQSRSPAREGTESARTNTERHARLRDMRYRIRQQSQSARDDVRWQVVASPDFFIGPFGRSGTRFGRRHGRNVGDYVRDEDFDGSYENLISLAANIGDVRPRSTPEHVIASLPTGFYKDWAGSNSDSRCPICLDDYKSLDPVLKLPDCSHWLHKDCLERWLRSARTCPVCRTRVKVKNQHMPEREAGPSRNHTRDDNDSSDESTSELEWLLRRDSS